jgi:hypothetical protein
MAFSPLPYLIPGVKHLSPFLQKGNTGLHETFVVLQAPPHVPSNVFHQLRLLRSTKLQASGTVPL